VPRDSTARSHDRVDPGEALEARVAQLWFWEGYFARRAVNLQRHYDPEPLQVTDLDLLAYDFDPHLVRSKLIGEVKGGTGRSVAKPLDRIIWVHGLADLVEANSAEMVTALPLSGRVRELAGSLRVTAQTTADLERRENAARVAEVADLGSQGVLSVGRMKAVHRHCATDPELERAFWFLRSEVWFLDPWSATKRVIGLVRQLAKRWVPQVTDNDGNALRWLFSEAVAIFTVNITALAGEAMRLDASQFHALAAERLAEGVVPTHYMRRLSDAIDRYVAGLLATVDAPATVRSDALGAFHPRPPDFTDPVVELIGRLAAAPSVTRRLGRQVDLLVFERVVHRREPLDAALSRLGIGEPARRAMRQMVAFLRGQARLPEELTKALSGDLLDAQGQPATTTSPLKPAAGGTTPQDLSVLTLQGPGRAARILTSSPSSSSWTQTRRPKRHGSGLLSAAASKRSPAAATSSSPWTVSVRRVCAGVRAHQRAGARTPRPTAVARTGNAARLG
jgi:hypothetical protein